jgi:DNA phosphorothioation-dependent restriction protein DptF
MLGNFATDGAEEHKDICESIRNFLGKGKESNSEHIFINFEQFPKFELKNENFKATFIGPILKRICAPVRENPIYLKWKQEPNNTNLHRNFALLCIPEIQEQICLLLFYAHLKFDQFLTARTVLDFICQILVRKGLLFDNIFCGPNTELFRALRMFDPCHARSKSLDLFQVKASLGLFEPDFYDFRAEIENRFRIEVFEPHSWIRLFYMLQDAKLGNNYHQQFRIDLQRNLFDDYREVWQLHRDYDGNSKENKTKLRNFYKNVLIPAVRRFANRLAPKLHYDRFFLGKINGFEISAKSSLQLNLKKIAASRPDQLRSFDAYLKVGNNCNVGPIPISSRFLDLARKINKGYRPNTHDKTTVVKLEELVEEIHRILRKSDVLYFKQKNHEWKLINEKEEDEILAVSL